MNVYYKLYIYAVIFLCSMVITSYSLADVGSCARYKLKVFMRSGESITGFFQVNDYDQNVSEWKEGKIIQRIKRKAKHSGNKIIIHKKIQTIKYPAGNKHYNFKYSAVANNDIKTFSADELTSIVKLGVTPCEHMRRSNADPYKISYSTQIIDGVTQSDIDLLQKKPQATISFTSHPEYYDSNYCLIYNRKIDKKKLKKICTRSSFYLKKQRKMSNKDFEELQKKNITNKINELRKQGVIFINLSEYY